MKSEIKTKIIGNVPFISYSGQTLHDLAKITPDFLRETVAANNTNKVVLNMESLTRFYSASINRLAQLLKTSKKLNCNLYLVNIPDVIINILNSVNILNMFDVYESDTEFIIDHNLEKELANPDQESGDIPTNEDFLLSIKNSGKNYTVSLSGQLFEMEKNQHLIDATQNLVNDDAISISIDLKNTVFIDSLTISSFITIHRLCEKKKVEFSLINVNSVIMDAIKLVGIDKSMKVTPIAS